MENWEKLRVTSSVIAAVVIPIVLLFVGNEFTTATKERELQGKFVELAAQVLREAPREETTNLREWATDVINLYSGVQLSAQTQRDLIEQTSFPIVSAAPPIKYFGVVFGGDKELESAKYEVETAGPKVGLAGAEIYLRKGMYRSVAVVDSRSEAVEVLQFAKDRRDDSYVVEMKAWCPNPKKDVDYYDCGND
ncbi:hypothetical protein MID13_09380 [Vibrio gigantis]|uniref:hypothetical protein n=1 Tax=Vibrio gigantis TaxID=296199 RepID=UPI001EFB8D3A|nr:hypothetical protein [Vibrio gigantis]ULN63143.1 hypothetical protein MID13_09380 [Vibrio gigantis]